MARIHGRNIQKKFFMTQITSDDGMITCLELDILESKVKWALESITTKLVRVTKFHLNYFKS